MGQLYENILGNVSHQIKNKGFGAETWLQRDKQVWPSHELLLCFINI
jgi:hypothetical protein